MAKKVKRCRSRGVFDLHCIGVSGHEGPHWAYDDHGRYCQWGSGLPRGVAAQQTPCGHPHYVTPLERHADTYLFQLVHHERHLQQEQHWPKAEQLARRLQELAEKHPPRPR